MRAFFALWPDMSARGALAKLAREVAAECDGRAPLAENIHLTLAFLGEVSADRMTALQATGAAVAATTTAFTLNVDRLGTFRGAGIAWAGASEVPPQLAHLVAKLNAALAAAGFAIDPRPFHAHVTLARRCRKSPSMPGAVSIAWPVARLVLNASELSSGAPRYRELGGWSLGQCTIDDPGA